MESYTLGFSLRQHYLDQVHGLKAVMPSLSRPADQHPNYSILKSISPMRFKVKLKWVMSKRGQAVAYLILSSSSVLISFSRTASSLGAGGAAGAAVAGFFAF